MMITFDQEERFTVDNDKKAEWALSKIRALKADMARYVAVCDDMITEYEAKKKAAQERYEQETSWFKSQLAQYFESVPKRKTKTQEVYELPGGTLRKKYPAPQYKRDNKKLVAWLKDSGMSDYIKVSESADWATLKKGIQVQGNVAITEDGEIVEGVIVIERPPTFEVEVQE